MKYAFTFLGSWNHVEFKGPYDTYEDMITNMIWLLDDDCGLEDQIDEIVRGEQTFFEDLGITVYRIKEEEFKDAEKVINSWDKEINRHSALRKKQDEDREKRHYERLKEKYEE